MALLKLSSCAKRNAGAMSNKNSFFIIIGFTTKVIIFFRGLEIDELTEEHLPIV